MNTGMPIGTLLIVRKDLKKVIATLQENLALIEEELEVEGEK